MIYQVHQQQDDDEDDTVEEDQVRFFMIVVKVRVPEHISKPKVLVETLYRTVRDKNIEFHIPTVQ